MSSRKNPEGYTRGINVTILDGSAGSHKEPLFDEKTGTIVGYKWVEDDMSGKTLKAIQVVRPDGSSYLR